MFKEEKTNKFLDYSDDDFIKELGISKWEYSNLYKNYLIEQDNKYYFSKKNR